MRAEIMPNRTNRPKSFVGRWHLWMCVALMVLATSATNRLAMGQETDYPATDAGATETLRPKPQVTEPPAASVMSSDDKESEQAA